MDFMRWLRVNRYNRKQAADLFGVHANTITRWKNSKHPSKLVGYACAAVAAGLEPWGDANRTPRENKT